MIITNTIKQIKQMKTTKEMANRQRKTTYEPPRAEVICIEMPCVLCDSGLLGNSTESVGRPYFSFP